MSHELALAKLHDVEALAEKLGQAESMLENGYAQFAAVLLEVQENLYWQLTHESWGKYMESLSAKFNMGKAQLYHKVAVVRELKGVVETPVLTDIGISKATVLADAYRAQGKLPNEVIDAAKDPEVTVKKLKKVLAEATQTAERQKDDWMELDFSGFYTPEQKAEVQEAIELAIHSDPPISNTLRDSAQKVEIFLKFAREFLSSNKSVGKVYTVEDFVDGLDDETNS